MSKFFHWLKENSSDFNINIDLNDFEKKINESISKMINYTLERRQEVFNFNMTNFILKLKTSLHNYPFKSNFINSFGSKNADIIWQEIKKFYNWTKTQDFNFEYREIWRESLLYLDKLNNYEKRDPEDEYKELFDKILYETKINAQKIKQLIIEAISRINNWNNTFIVIKMLESLNNYHEVDLSSSNSAEIILKDNNFSPSFIIVYHNQPEIDDVLDAGDTDFFTNIDVQNDYFNLINEIKNPGSSSKGKKLILYTARPRKDREYLLKNNVLPINIFLTNNLSHAEGLSTDLAISNEKRDIWKVKINNKYLFQTLDGNIKYYQIIEKDAPIEMELLNQD